MLAKNLGVGSAESKLVGHAVTVGLIAIVSTLEKSYIHEWIDYHKKVGV